MTWRTDSAIRDGAGALAAATACGGASPRRPVERRATLNPQRGRALRRATRSAAKSMHGKAAHTEESLRCPSPHAGRRAPKIWLPPGNGGPCLLTEDRQKPKVQLQRPA